MNLSPVNSTACSSPNNGTVEKIILNDSVRYRRKGIGLLVSILITLFYFFVMPHFLRYAFPIISKGVDPLKLMVVSTWCFHVGFNFTSYCVSYFLYTSKHPFLEKYRILDKPWPWEENPEEWKKIFKMTGLFFFINQCIITPTLIYIDVKMNGVFVSLSPDNFPSCLTIILQCFFCMLIDDFFFYWGHRLLHHPKLYPYIHKIHHKWNHTVIISNEFSHPFEYIIANLPAACGPKLLGKNMHMTTLWMWIVMRVGESLDSHCGYEFSWSPYRLLPLSGSSQYHDFHHSNNVGNYGSYFTFWDTLFKTNEVYFKHIAKREREAAISQIREQYSVVKQKVIEGMDKKND
jgi:methylsterol monooxygenase/4-alpha-methyl-delta7-sterol-4alpha-methyl oxidase